MTEDQRFAATRPDVLVYKIGRSGSRRQRVRTDRGRSEGLHHRHRFRFRRQVIDVYPNDAPDYNARAARPRPDAPPAAASRPWAAISN